MKLIILAALIATSIAWECSTGQLKTSQRCWKPSIVDSDCATLSDPATCSACNLGYTLSDNDCSKSDTYKSYHYFGSAQSGHASQCNTYSNGLADYQNKAGCLYDGYPVCNSCASGKFVKDGTCSGTCTDAGCDECSDAATCTKCKSGYRLEGTACEKCDAYDNGCTECASVKTTCTKCSAGKGVKDGDCVTCDDTTGCADCAGNKAECTTCYSTHYKSGTTCTACNAGGNNVVSCSGDPATEANITQCTYGTYFVTGKGCLAKDGTVDKCLEIDGTTKKCTSCYGKYILHQDSCVLPSSVKTGCIAATKQSAAAGDATCTDCVKESTYDRQSPNGVYAYYLDGNNDCKKCGKGCKSCTGASGAAACDGGCVDGFYKDGDDKCQTCTDANAKTCNQDTGVSTACKDGYKPWKTSTNETCTGTCDATCAYPSGTCNDAGECLTCTSSSKYVNDQNKCADKPANCDTVTAKSADVCTKCDSGYALASNACGSSKITNCYSSQGTDDKCEYCKLGYKSVAGVCKACTESDVSCPKTACPALSGGSGSASVLAFCSTLLLFVLAFLF